MSVCVDRKHTIISIPPIYKWVCCLATLGLMSQSVLLGQVTLMTGMELAGESSFEEETSLPELEIEEYVSASYAQVATRALSGSGVGLRMRPTWSPNSYVKLDVDFTYLHAFGQIGAWVIAGDTVEATQIRSRRVVISPGLTLGLGERRFSPYVRIAWLVPQTYSVVYRTFETQSIGQVSQDFQVDIRTFHGLSASLGAQYRIAPSIRLYYEISYQNQLTWVEAIELVRYEVNGADALDLLATYQVKARFQEVFGNEPNQPDHTGFDPNRPLEVESRAQSASTLRLSLGLVFVIAR